MIRNNIAKDFRTLSQILGNWDQRVKNSGILNEINVQTSSDEKHLDYAILSSNPLVFTNPDIERHCLPKGIEKMQDQDFEAKIQLSTTIRQLNLDQTTDDPIVNLGLLLTIDLLFLEEEQIRTVSCSWHLDRDSSIQSDYNHPLYHLNFGGQHMTKQANAFGDLLLLTAPRIIHPPMDIVLGCDFIVRNFYKKATHLQITSLPSYKRILRNAKDRYWKPYTGTLASVWFEDTCAENLEFMQLTGYSI